MKHFSVAALCAAALLMVASVHAGAADAPAQMRDDGAAVAANGFYAAYEGARPMGVPDVKTQARFDPLLSRALHAALDRARKAEAAYKTQTGGQVPPLVEGDIFTSLYEGATAHAVDHCAAAGPKQMRCTAHLTYSDADNPPTHWTDTIMLVHEGGGWKVDDIAYGGSWDFARKGTLSDALTHAVAEAAAAR